MSDLVRHFLNLDGERRVRRYRWVVRVSTLKQADYVVASTAAELLDATNAALGLRLPTEPSTTFNELVGARGRAKHEGVSLGPVRCQLVRVRVPWLHRQLLPALHVGQDTTIGAVRSMLPHLPPLGYGGLRLSDRLLLLDLLRAVTLPGCGEGHEWQPASGANAAVFTLDLDLHPFDDPRPTPPEPALVRSLLHAPNTADAVPPPPSTACAERPCWRTVPVLHSGNDIMASCASTALYCEQLLPDAARGALLTHFEALGRPAVAARASGGMRVWRWIDPDGFAVPRARKGGAVEWQPLTIAARRLPCGRWAAQLATPLADVDARAAAGVYAGVAQAFATMLPALWRVLDADDAAAARERPRNAPPPAADPSRVHLLRVVVKAQASELPPSHEYSGYWHQEGAGEGIRAVGLYYLHAAPALGGAELRLRHRLLTYAFSSAPFARDGSDDAAVRTSAGAAVVFSNRDVVHRVANVRNADAHRAARRAYLAFFVIDRTCADAPADGETGAPAAAAAAAAADDDADADADAPASGLFGYRDVRVASVALQRAMRGAGGVQLPESLYELIALHVPGVVSRAQAEATRAALSATRTPTLGDATLYQQPAAPGSMDDVMAAMNGWCAMDGGVMMFRGGPITREMARRPGRVPPDDVPDWQGDQQS